MKKRSFLWILTGCALSACAREYSISPTGQIITSLPTYTKEISSPTPTFTNTKTWIPTNTITAGPPPDLEIVNWSVSPDDFETAFEKHQILGRMKNNLSEPMVFYYSNPPFTFTFDVWEKDPLWSPIRYIHSVYKQSVKTTDAYGIMQMNCVLYPEERGVFNFTTSTLQKEYIYWRDQYEYDGPLGLSFMYESIYHIDNSLPKNLHPKTENISFSINRGILFFEYDVKNVPAPIDLKNPSYLNSWIIVFDKENKIINILYKSLGELGGVEPGKDFHVQGKTNTSMNDREHYFKPAVKFNSTMINTVDHLEVLNEFEEGTVCSSLGK